MHQQNKIEKNKLKKVCIKNYTCYYFEDIIELEQFDIDNILINEKPHENIFIYESSYKTLINQNLCTSNSIKKIGLLELMLEPNI